MRPIICLMGPTASGKTDLSLKLAQQYPVEIISADSALVYRGLDKGTAKPSKEQLKAAPHHLIDICEPHTAYSAGNFYKDANIEINNIYQRGKIPLIVGGTLLYFWILQHGIAELPSANESVRQSIAERAKSLGWASLHKELQTIDPVSALKIQPQDGQRIQRALEVYELTGKPMSICQKEFIQKTNHQMVNIVLTTQDRNFLHQRIAKRLQIFFSEGLIDEVRDLRKHPLIQADLPAMRLVGYRQVWEYLDGQYDERTLQERAYHTTCQLVKRQFTWLRRWENAIQIPIDELSNQSISIKIRDQLALILNKL